jgi:hypothetical protein
MRFWRSPRGTLLHLRMGKVFTACGHRIRFATWTPVVCTPLPAVEQVCPKCHEKWRSAETVNQLFGSPA